jgi:hypothetical protein
MMTRPRKGCVDMLDCRTHPPWFAVVIVTLKFATSTSPYLQVDRPGTRRKASQLGRRIRGDSKSTFLFWHSRELESFHSFPFISPGSDPFSENGMDKLGSNSASTGRSLELIK